MIKKINIYSLIILLGAVVASGFWSSGDALAINYAAQRTVASGQVLPAGMIVVQGADNTVRAARQGEEQQVTGIVAPLPSEALAANAIGVSSSGVMPVLVSDLGGQIKAGDRIAISPLNGVGMKAQGSGWIIGTAQTDAPISTRNTVAQQVESMDGKVVTAHLVVIPLLFSVSYYNVGQDMGLPPAVRAAIEAIAGHAVTPYRAWLALIVFGIAMILLVVMVYSAVKNSLTAIGRNPMANTKISKSLTKVLLTALSALAMTLGIIYIIVR